MNVKSYRIDFKHMDTAFQCLLNICFLANINERNYGSHRHRRYGTQLWCQTDFYTML